MGKNTSISLGAHFEEFINNEISTGRYASTSEVIRSALRLLEKQKTRTKELVNALEEGEQSGMVENFDPKSHLKSLRSNKS